MGIMLIHPFMEATVIKQVLDNGLTLLIEERRESPVASIVTHVKTGYFDEPDELMGISHVFEHMFFKGTRRRPGPENIARETKELGGILNAGTGYEATSYYVVMPTENFERAMDIQFDALTNPLLDQAELEKEIEVVIQEARQKLDSPSSFSLEKMWEQSFQRHRIRRWRIGYPENLRNINSDDLLAYYRGRYAPQNIIVSIVGGVESGLALQLAQQFYAEIPARELTVNQSPEEPEQTFMKYSRLHGDINQKLMHIGFHAPSVLDSDYYPLSVAVDILGDGRSSRLHQSLMEEKQVVSGISSYYSAYRDVGVVTVSAEVLADDLRDVNMGVFEEIEKLKKEPIHHAEMEKIKNVIESDFFFEQEQVLGRASRIAYYEALGDYKMSEEFVERLRSVQPDDVARAAEKYLAIDRATVLEYVPEGAELPQYDAEGLAEQTTRTITQLPMALPITVETADTNLRRAALPSGAVLVTDLESDTPIAGIAVYFKGGKLCETSKTAGITELALRSSLKGTSKYSAEEIARRIESLGTNIGMTNSSDFFGYTLRILAKSFDEGFELLSDVIAEPSFPDEEVAKEREALRADIRRLKDTSFGQAAELLSEVAFPDHPYGLPDYGSEEGVASLTRDQVADWYSSVCSPDTAVVSIVGNVHPDTATKAAESLMQRLARRAPLCAPSPVMFPQEVREKSVDRERAQTAVAIGFPGLASDDPGRYDLDVTAAVSSGLGGRLFAEVRGRLGLAYVVSAASHSGALGGMFIVYTATSPENEERAREAIIAEMTRLRDEPPEVAEIERAKNYLKGARLISLQTSVSRARDLGMNEIYGRGLRGTAEYLEGIARVTPEDILNSSRRHFNSSRYCLGIVRGTANGKE